jgi:hypothetical protein
MFAPDLEQTLASLQTATRSACGGLQCGVCWKFMRLSSQAEDHLGDDVSLDLVGAAIDRQRPELETARGGRRRFHRSDPLGSAAFRQRFGDERSAHSPIARRYRDAISCAAGRRSVSARRASLAHGRLLRCRCARRSTGTWRRSSPCSLRAPGFPRSSEKPDPNRRRVRHSRDTTSPNRRGCAAASGASALRCRTGSAPAPASPGRTRRSVVHAPARTRYRR